MPGDATNALSDPEPFEVSFPERLHVLSKKPALDVHVTDHCNLRCKGCVHFAPLAPKHCLDLGNYEADLTALAAIPGIEDFFRGLYLMGGEPLLHPLITDVVSLTRRLLPGIRIVLATNGILLKRMGNGFWDALAGSDAELHLSPYPIGVDYVELLAMARARGVNAAFAVDLTGRGAGKEGFFRLALDPKGAQDPVRSFNTCFFGGSYMQLHRGSIWNCQVAAHHDILDDAFGWGLESGPGDELPLSRIASTCDIEAFRRSAHPMCRFCANDRMQVAVWERSRRDEHEWRM